ncbi:hypothetical protein [Arthrobacter sp. JCM 19049]|uniref:hypothetical protein n=1 Tax=Arthrobacter sp. JCM 19049 TaxID=1460643 RepID=UPI002436354D|nr:hypothetical protein [Arthrobacter sp. JCM 19049]
MGFIWLLTRFPQVLASDPSLANGLPNAPPSIQIPWIPGFLVNLDFRLDTLAAVLLLLILGVGAWCWSTVPATSRTTTWAWARSQPSWSPSPGP